jgi:DNA-binding NarL/FixJ family response regulator
MAKIKVLLASQPKLLSDVIRNLIARQLDMEIIGEVTDPLKLLITTADKFADAVIITPLKANGEPRLCSRLLAAHPALKIITLDIDTDTAYLYRLNHDRMRFETPTGLAVLNILRGGPMPPAV